MYQLILSGAVLSPAEIHNLESVFATNVNTANNAYYLQTAELLEHEQLQQWRDRLDCDVNILPPGFDPQKIKLVVSDMDSTFINIECIDEIADFAGVKDKVSEVTEAAMRGELKFEESLIARVSLLKGLDESVLQKVYDQRLRLNPGAKDMLAGLQQHNIRFALVSGGFTFFTSRLQKEYGLDYTLSNTLEIENGKLTGRVVGNIVGAEAKANFLLEKCKELKIEPSQAVAIGDGANDLKMMSEAGMGVAYKAKPKVQAAADCCLNYGGLEGLLRLLGI